MRWSGLGLMALLALGCAETVRCPDDEVFDEAGECIPIRDAGPGDAGDDAGSDGG